MSRVHYAIMSHPDRLEMDAPFRIQTQLGRHVEVYTDWVSRGPWHPAREAWTNYSSLAAPADWCCLLQDDVDLAPGFADALEALVAADDAAYRTILRQRPLSLCNGLRDRAPNGVHWLERQDGVHGPCIVMPQMDILPMLVWVLRHVRETPEFMFDDIRVSLWLEAMGRTSLWPDPSWLNHRGWEPSLLGYRSTKSQPRTAPSYTGAPLSEIDWAASIPHAPLIGNPRGASLRVSQHLWRTSESESDHALARKGHLERVYGPS